MRSNSRRGSASLRINSSPKIRAAIRPLVDALERRLLLSGTLPSFAQPSPDAVYYTGGTSGAMTLDVTAGTIAFNANVADDGSDWQNLTVEASGSAHLIFNSPQTLSLLGLFDNATVTVSQGNNGSASNLLQLNTLVVNPTATLDLGDSAMILYYQPSEQSSDLSTVQSLLKSGYNGGAWNGTGIDSSSAANDPSKDTSLGYMDNNDLQSPYAGINFTQFNQIIVGYTYYGDVDLNRSFDSTDVDQLIAGRSGQGSGWEYGDFNYDGYTDDADTTIFTNEHAKWQQQLIDTGQYTPAFHLAPLPIQPDWNTPFDGDIAIFTDTVNTNLDASAYVADVYWGDGSLSIAQVTATDTPGSFRINAISPVFTTANPIMLMTLQYADGSGYQSESAIAAEPIDVLQLPPGVNASANAVYSISGPSGNVQLNLTAGSLSFDTNASNDSNYFQNLNFTVSGSAHAYFNSPQDFNALTIKDNAIVTLSRGGGGANGNRLNVQSLSIDPNATLDLADNALIDWYAIWGGSAARSQMQSWVSAGYNGGAWTGHGIVSSLAAADTTSSLGVGLMDNGYDYVDHSIDPSYITFAGVNLQSKNQMLVRLAYYGDANLDGQVDDTDLYLWNSGYNRNGYTGWVYGDFNYDGQVDNTTDLNAWTANYGLSTTTGNFAPAFQPTGILINPTEGVPFSGDIATFYDILNPSNTDASIYTAQVDWGDGHFVAAQVTATSTPGSFRINALSQALTDPNAVMTVTIEYADMNDPSPTYEGRPAAVSEPMTMTPAVANLVASAVSTSEIDLTWTLNAPNASAVEVDRSTDGINWSTVTNTLSGTATSFADTTGLTEVTHYYYRVRAIWSAGPSAFTSTADAWTLANAPSALSASSNGSNEVDLSWTNNSAVATQFQIERSDDGTNFYTLDTTTGTTYSDTFADDGSTYWYRVEALNGNGDLSLPSEASSTSTALAAPSELTATAVSASEIDLAWSDDSVTATGYEVDRSTDGVNFTPLAPDLTADTTSYSDTGLDAGSHFYYHVISLTGGQLSAPSNPADDTTVPPSPDSDWVTTTSSSVTVNWDAAQGATGYEVDRSVNGNWVDMADITGGSTTSFTDSGLLSNTSFSYQISAKNNAGQSSPIGVSATTSIETPASPSNVQAIALSATSAEIVWTNNADNETGFNISCNNTTIGHTDPGVTKFVDANLSPATAYDFAVQAFNSQTTSAWSDSQLTTPSLPTGYLQKPQPPSGLVATGTATSIQLQWTASPTPLVNYWIERTLPNSDNWGVIAINWATINGPYSQNASTTFTDNPSLSGVNFSYRVLAANAEYTSDGYAGAAQAMKPYPVPPPPDSVQHHIWQQGYKASISWKPATDPASVDYYLVKVTYTFSGNTDTIRVGVNECLVTASASDPDFTYEVYACNQAGMSDGASSSNGNLVETKDDPYIGGTIQSASVDSQGLVTLNTVGGAVSEVEYTDDLGLNNWVGTVGVTNNGGTQTFNVPLGAHLWIRSYQGGGAAIPLDIPELPKITGLSEETDGADAYGDATFAGLYYNWGSLAPQADAQMEIAVDGGPFADFTSAGASSGTQYEGPKIDAQPFEGGTYVGQLRQEQTISSMPVITGYSSWQSYDPMNAMPAAPLKVTATAISGGKVRLLWAEGSEGETQQTIKCLTGRFLDTLVSSTTVPAGITTFDYGPLPVGTYVFQIMESSGDSGTRPMGASSPWTGSNAVTIGTTSVSISPILGAAELGPDDHPQDGYFEISRSGSTDGDLTLNVDLSGTAVLGSQYATDAGGASPVQVTIPQGASAVLLEIEPLQAKPGDPGRTVIATLEPQTDVGISNGSATLNITGIPSLSFIAHRTGVKQGQVVDPSLYSIPADFAILANNNYDDGAPDQPDDENTNASPSQDPDLARFTIQQIPAGLNQISLTLSDPTAVRLIRADGHVFYMHKDASDSSYDPNFNSLDVLTSSRGDGKYLARAFDGSLDFWVEGLSTSADFTITLSASINGGQVLWSQTVHMNIASISTAATSLLLLNGASGPAPGDSIPESAKFRSYLDGFDGYPPLVKISQDGGTSASQTVGLIATSNPNHIGFDVYYPPGGATSVEPTQEAVALNIADDSLFSADVVTAKDEFARQIDGASRSFYQYAYVYDGFDPTPPEPMDDGGSSVATQTNSAAADEIQPNADPATNVSNLAVAPTDTTKLFTGDTADDGLGKAMLAYYRTMYGAPGQLLLYGFLFAHTHPLDNSPTLNEKNQIVLRSRWSFLTHPFSDSRIVDTKDSETDLMDHTLIIRNSLTPADAAAELFGELLDEMSEASIEHTIQDEVIAAIPNSNDPDGIWNAYSSLVKSYLKSVATTAENWAKMYYSGIAMVGEGANVVVTINELSQGNISSLLNLLPLAGQAMAATSKGSAALFQMQMYGGAIMENLDTAACKILGDGGCFAAGTTVQTENGPEPIEQVHTGDLVWAFNMQSHSWEFDPVQTAFSKPFDGTIVTATVAGQAISMTADHPVYVVSGNDLSSRPIAVGTDDMPQTEPGRWVDAADLQVGDVLKAEHGSTTVVGALSLAYESTQVYSLTVDNAHTFAVGADGVLVHNGCTPQQFQNVQANWQSWFPVRRIKNADGTLAWKAGDVTLINAESAFANGGSLTAQLKSGGQVTVQFSRQGFPDFTPFLYTGTDGKNTVSITYSGYRQTDRKLASIAAGFVDQHGDWYVPDGYVWHHTEGLKMQLVRQDVHEAIKHTGGFAIFKAGMRKLYMDAGLPIPSIYL